MPTTRPRHHVTETAALARALETAERRWPGRSRSQLLVALIEVGVDAIERDEAARREERRQLVDEHAGGFHFPPGYLEELRADWPE